jgi:uncharacterized protein (TIGR04255 family)
LVDRTIYPNAPIAEALLDIRVRPSKDITLPKLETFQNKIEGYPNKEEQKRWSTGFKVDPQSGPENLPSTGGPIGCLFRSSDGRQIVQAQLDGFTFNRLKPYEKWEKLRDEAKTLWKQYLVITTPELITRIALRYINRIEIPFPILELGKYILTRPDIAEGIQHNVESSFMRLVITKPGTKYKAIVTQTNEPVDVTKNVLPFIFDIDVFYDVPIKVEGEELWTRFEELHEFKNDIFYKSITPKTEKLFQ